MLRTGWPIAERDLIAPLMRDGRAIGVLAATTHEPRDWTVHDVTFIRTVATHASIALLNGELVEQAEARAAQLAVLQAASARMSRENSVEQVGRAVVEETRSIIDYHNARVYLVEPLGDVVPIAFEGVVGTYDDVDFDLLRCKMGEGFTGWVALARRAAPRRTTPTPTRAARRSQGPTTSTNRCSSSRCATTGRSSA